MKDVYLVIVTLVLLGIAQFAQANNVIVVAVQCSSNVVVISINDKKQTTAVTIPYNHPNYRAIQMRVDSLAVWANGNRAVELCRVFSGMGAPGGV